MQISRIHKSREEEHEERTEKRQVPARRVLRPSGYGDVFTCSARGGRARHLSGQRTATLPILSREFPQGSFGSARASLRLPHR